MFEVIGNDVGLLVAAVLTIVAAILPIVNPPGDASLFLQMTHGCDEATRSRLARRIAFYSFGLLLGSLVLGPLVLRIFDLSVPVIQVAGGAVVIAFGWKLLNEDPKPVLVDLEVDREQLSSRMMGQAFYPLTLPLTVDPGALAVALSIGANHGHTIDAFLIQTIAAVIGSAVIALTILLTYLYARRVAEKIGHEGMNIVLRLSAFIVLSIGVQIAWNGVTGLLRTVGLMA